MPSGQITEIVGSERPKPVSPTPWWMLHTVGEVAPETRIIIAATVGARCCSALALPITVGAVRYPGINDGSRTSLPEGVLPGRSNTATGRATAVS